MTDIIISLILGIFLGEAIVMALLFLFYGGDDDD